MSASAEVSHLHTPYMRLWNLSCLSVTGHSSTEPHTHLDDHFLHTCLSNILWALLTASPTGTLTSTSTNKE